jgi:hypothetical protein
MVTGLKVPPAITLLRRTLMKFFRLQRSEKDRTQVEQAPQREPEGHVHPNYRHWVYFKRSDK